MIEVSGVLSANAAKRYANDLRTRIIKLEPTEFELGCSLTLDAETYGGDRAVPNNKYITFPGDGNARQTLYALKRLIRDAGCNETSTLHLRDDQLTVLCKSGSVALAQGLCVYLNRVLHCHSPHPGMIVWTFVACGTRKAYSFLAPVSWGESRTMAAFFRDHNQRDVAIHFEFNKDHFPFMLGKVSCAGVEFIFGRMLDVRCADEWTPESVLRYQECSLHIPSRLPSRSGDTYSRQA